MPKDAPSESHPQPLSRLSALLRMAAGESGSPQERLAALKKLDAALKSHGTNLDEIADNPERLLPDQIETLRTKLQEFAAVNQALATQNDALIEENERLRGRLGIKTQKPDKNPPAIQGRFNRLCNAIKSSPTSRWPAEIWRSLPIYGKIGLALSPLSPLIALTARLLYKDAFLRPDLENEGGETDYFWFTLELSSIICAAEIGGSSLLDQHLTNSRMNEQIQETLANVPCNLEAGQKVSVCFTQVAKEPYFLFSLFLPGDGVGPKIVAIRTTELSGETAINQSGQNGILQCTQKQHLVFDGALRGISPNVWEKAEIHNESCQFLPSIK